MKTCPLYTGVNPWNKPHQRCFQEIHASLHHRAQIGPKYKKDTVPGYLLITRHKLLLIEMSQWQSYALGL